MYMSFFFNILIISKLLATDSSVHTHGTCIWLALLCYINNNNNGFKRLP